MLRRRAYIGLGANVGDARAALTAAVAALRALPGARMRGVSRLYRTAPVGVVDQPDFHNAVVSLDVPAGPDLATGATALLVALKGIERAFGRRARGRWGPRELDLDLLLFGRARLAIERDPGAAPASAARDPAAAARLLEVPHPAMRDRLFVLAPLADLAPRLVPPGWMETIETARRRRASEEGPSAALAVGWWSPHDRTWVGPSGGPIVVDHPASTEVDAIARVHTAASDAAYRGLAPIRPGGLARRTAMWQGLLEDQLAGCFVARDAGRIVGVLNIGPDLDGGPDGEVRILYVHPAWWGSGAGQLLMERAHGELARAYAGGVLTVLLANPRARRFYERNGWTLAEVLVEEHFGGRPVDVARYRRPLGGARRGD